MDNIYDTINRMFLGSRVQGGEIAWNNLQICEIIKLVRAKKCIILGGDVYAEDGSFEYASWYFNPDAGASLDQNVIDSITKCQQFINDYSARNGPNHRYVLVISQSYIAAMGFGVSSE